MSAAPSLPNVTQFENPPRSTGERNTTLGGRLRSLASEPFLHFALLGALVFAGHRALTRGADVPVLEVSGAKQRELTKLFEQRQHRPPTAEEREQLVSRYVEDEALFREGLRLSLVQTDPMLRAQLIARVRALLQAEVAERTPSEEQLRGYYDEHLADYAVPESVSLREYLLPSGPDARDQSRHLSLALQRGDEPDAAALPPPTDHSRRSQAELGAILGADLANRIWTLPTGVWRELAGKGGIHVVRVDEHAQGSEPPFESVRERVLSEYRKDEVSRAFTAEVQRLTSQWRVRVGAEP